MNLLNTIVREKIRYGLVILGLLGVTVALYGQILDNYFLNDDFGRILALQGLQDVSMGDAFIALFENSYHGAYYRPFTNITFYLLRKFSGLEAWGYYLSSLLLHILAATALYASLERLRKNIGLDNAFWCFAAACFFFLINPRHVESVSYIHDNENIICGLFFFLGFYSFIGFCTHQKAGAIFVFALCYLGSLFGKEMGVTLPLICMTYYVIIVRGLDAREKPLVYKDPILYKTALISALAFSAYMMMRYQALGEWVGGAGPTAQLSFTTARIARTMVQAFIAMVIPNDLPILSDAANYFRDHIGLFLAISTLGIGVSLWFLRKMKSRIFWFGIAWSVLSLVPILNNGIGVDVLTGGRYLYIPIAGLSICIAVVLSQLSDRKWLVFVVLCALAFYSFHTYHNNSLMVYVSRISERFLKGIEGSWRETKGAHATVFIPGMYRGIYILPGAFSSAVTLIYEKESADILESVDLQLIFEIEDHRHFLMEVKGDEGGPRILRFSGGGILWKPELYDLEVVKNAGLEFERKKMLNTQGDFLAEQVSLDIRGTIWVPAFIRKDDAVFGLPQ